MKTAEIQYRKKCKCNLIKKLETHESDELLYIGTSAWPHCSVSLKLPEDGINYHLNTQCNFAPHDLSHQQAQHHQ